MNKDYLETYLASALFLGRELDQLMVKWWFGAGYPQVTIPGSFWGIPGIQTR